MKPRSLKAPCRDARAVLATGDKTPPAPRDPHLQTTRLSPGSTRRPRPPRAVAAKLHGQRRLSIQAVRFWIRAHRNIRFRARNKAGPHRAVETLPLPTIAPLRLPRIDTRFGSPSRPRRCRSLNYHVHVALRVSPGPQSSESRAGLYSGAVQSPRGAL